MVRALAWILAVILVPTWALAQPPIVGRVDFDDLTNGAIATDRYRPQGILLDCTPGHWLYAVQRDGYYGRSVAISPGGDDLYIAFEFVLPGTEMPGAVQATDIQVLDAGNRGYAYEYYDIHGHGANNGSNHGDYRVGEGWYYSDGPVAHRFVLRVGTGVGVFLDRIGFSTIVGGALPVQSATWSAVRSLYR